MLTTIIMPVNCTNNETWSISEVTRDTSEPRRSEFCVSIDRSCTCRNAYTRSCASPRSLAMNNRTFVAYAQIPVTATISAAPTTYHHTCERSTAPANPLSTITWITMGTTELPTVLSAASSNVTP